MTGPPYDTSFMNDPAAVAYRKKHGIVAQPPVGQQQPDDTSFMNDPAAVAYRKKHGIITAAPPAAPPAPAEEGPGIIERGFKGAKGALKAGAEFFLSAPDFIEGAVLSPLASAYKAANPEGFERARKEAQGKPDYLHVPTMGELAKGLVTAPIESAKAALSSTDPEEAGYNAAMTALMTYGLYHVGKKVVTKGMAKFGSKPPAPTAPAGGSPTAEVTVQTADEIGQGAIKAHQAKIDVANNSRSATNKRKFAWEHMTPEQRAWMTPELPATDHVKRWDALSDQGRSTIKESWTVRNPLAETTPTTPPPTAGEAEKTPSVVGEIGAEGKIVPALDLGTKKIGLNRAQQIYDGATIAQRNDNFHVTKPWKDLSGSDRLKVRGQMEAQQREIAAPPPEPTLEEIKADLQPPVVPGKVVGEIKPEPKIEVPPVEDLSRGTYGGPGARAAPRQPLSPEELLKAMRQRSMLPEQTTSGGTLDQPAPPRTPEAEAAMRGIGTEPPPPAPIPGTPSVESTPEPAPPSGAGGVEGGKAKRGKPRAEPTIEQMIDKRESKNNAKLDKGKITEVEWQKEHESIVEARRILLSELKPKPVEPTAERPKLSETRRTVKPPKTGPALDPSGFRARLKDNLGSVPTPELELRLEELRSRTRVDPTAAEAYQPRINQLMELIADRAQKRHAGPGSPIELFKKRKILHDVPVDEMSPAEREINKSVITEPDLFQPEGIAVSLRKKISQLVDSEYGFKRAAKIIFGKKSREARILKLYAEMPTNALTRAGEFTRGQGSMLPDATGENWSLTGNRAVNDIVQSVGGESMVGRLNRTWASLNAIEQYGRGKHVGIDFIAANKFIHEVDPAFIKASVELRALALDLAKWREWSGLIEQGTVARLSEQKYYAPIRRILSFEGEGNIVGTVGGKDIIKIAKPGVQRLKGSALPQQGPVETLLDQIYRTIKESETNWRVSELTRGAIEHPEAAKGILEPASHAEQRLLRKTMDAKVNAAVAEAKSQGIEMSRQEALAEIQTYGNENLNIVNNKLQVWRNGKPTLWRVSDELAYALKHMKGEEFKLWVRLAGVPAGIVHGGVVADPFFPVRNMVLDNFTAFINSEYGFNPLRGDQLRGYMDIMRDSPWAKENRIAGGTVSGITSSRFRKVSTSLADAVRPKTHGPVSESVAQVKEMSPWQAWKTMVAPMEEAARVSEYIHAREGGASMLESVYASKRVSINWARMGGEMAALSHMTPFLNAAIQTIAQSAENFAAHPARWTSRAALVSAGPAFALWWVNKDDKKIQELRKSEGGSRYLFMRGPDGEVWKLRKNYLEGAIFGSGIEAALDKAYNDDPEAMNRWGMSIAKELAFNAIPTFASVPISLFANKDLRTGLPIVPERVAGLAEELQFGPYTGTASKLAGEKLGVSPARLEYTARGFTGGLGAQVLKGIDIAIEYNRSGDVVINPGEIPGLSSFIAKSPTLSVHSVQQFYKESERLAKITNTIEYYSQNDPDKLQAYMEKHQGDLRLADAYAGFRSDIAATQHVINEVRNMPSSRISHAERVKMLQDLTELIIEKAQRANSIGKNLKAE